MLKIGLIGAGFMGATHAACYEILQKKKDLKVTAVADLREEKAKGIADKFGATVFKTGEDLIANADVNVIDICLPTYLHASHAATAMEKGYDVFVEKPLCLSNKDANKLIEVQKKTKVKAAVGQCIRFWPEYQFLKSAVDKKEYGKIRNAVFKRISPKPDWAWENWLDNPEKSGSAAIDLHIHDTDFVRYILGEPKKIKSAIGYNGGKAEHIYSTFIYDDTVVSLEGAWDYPGGFPFEMEYRVAFEKAVIVFNSNSAPSLKVYLNDGKLIVPELNNLDAKDENLGGNISSLGGYYNELEYFIDCVLNKKEITIAPISEGAKSLDLVFKELKFAK